MKTLGEENLHREYNISSDMCFYHDIGKSNPIKGFDRHWGFQEAEAPRF
jgi:hypothetical protein